MDLLFFILEVGIILLFMCSILKVSKKIKLSKHFSIKCIKRDPKIAPQRKCMVSEPLGAQSVFSLKIKGLIIFY